MRAAMVKHIGHYPWSSYQATMGLTDCPGWLNTDWLLSHFGKHRAVAQRHYADFVAEGVGLLSPWSAVRGQVLLGSEAFVEKMRPLLEQKNMLKEIPLAQRLLHRPSLMVLFTKVIQGDKVLRDEAIRKAYLDYGYSMAAIARHAEVHYSTVRKIIKGER